MTGFPNFFMLYGPNTNAPSSIIFMLECQSRYIVSAIKTLRKKGARYMNVRADRQRDFNTEAQERLSTTVPARADCFTYFKDRERQDHHQLAGLCDRISLAHTGGEITRL